MRSQNIDVSRSEARALRNTDTIGKRSNASAGLTGSVIPKPPRQLSPPQVKILVTSPDPCEVKFTVVATLIRGIGHNSWQQVQMAHNVDNKSAYYKKIRRLD